MKIIFDEKNHIYKVEDKVENRIVPSVNQILDTVFGKTFPKDNIFVQRACEKGRYIHNCFDEYIKYGKMPSFDFVEFRNFRNLQNVEGLKFNQSEVRLYKKIEGMEYCGTADAIDTKRKHITDYKTGSTIRKKHWQYQLSFYAHAKRGIKEISVFYLHNDKCKYIPLEILPKEEIVEVLKEYKRITGE